MADKTLKSLTFPGLSDKYLIPDLEVDDTLTQHGKAADAKAVGDALTALESDISTMSEDIANKADIITDTATGAIASFPDGSDGLPLKSLVASIEPVQDLHGQDAPYPPGGGRNLLPMTLASIKTINTAGTWNGNTYALSGISYSVNVDDGGNIESITANGTATAYSLLRLCNNITFDVDTMLKGCPASSYSDYKLQAEASVNYQDIGNGVTIPANTSITRIIVAVPSGVSASNTAFYPRVIDKSASDQSFSPYSNECPISGWTGMNGQRTGVNLFDKANGAKNLYVGAGDKTGTGGTLLCFLAKKGCQYTINMTGGNRTNLYYYDASSLDDIVSGITLTQVTLSATKPYTFIANRDAVYCYYADTNYQQSVADSCQVTVGASTADYAPYSAESLSVSWQDTAGTVYGGNITVNEDGSGDLVVKNINADGGTLTWVQHSTYPQCFFANISQSSLPPYSNGRWGMTSRYKCVYGSYISLARITEENYSAFIAPLTWSATISYIVINDPSIATVEEFASAMSGVQIVYEFATPLTYHFDNLTQLSSVYGINNIFVDCGQTTAEYRADTKLYIDKKLAALVAALS